MQPSISVIIPAHNEAETIQKCIASIYNCLADICEIIVVDDNSDDLTYTYVMGSDTPAFVLKNTGVPGKGSALKLGISTANHDLTATIDADLQVKPDEIKTFIKAMDHHNADAVIGNKRHPYSNVAYTPARWIISNAYNLMTRILFGFSLRDSQCGLKLFRAEALKKIMPKILVKEFAYDIEILIALRENGYRVVDAPIRLTQQYNAGSISVSSIYQTAKDTLAVWWRWRCGWYKGAK